MTHANRPETWLAVAVLVLLLPFLAFSQAQNTTSTTQTTTAQTQTSPPQSTIPSITATQPSPAEVARGSGLTFIGQNFPANAGDIAVFLNGVKTGTVNVLGPTAFVLTTPNDISLGKYNVSVQFKGVPATLPNSALTIYSEYGKSEPKIKAVVPLVTYPEKEVYGFDIIGEGFSTRSSDNGLVVNQSETAVCWADDPKFEECASNQDRVKGTVVNGQQLHFEWKIPTRYQGGAQIQMRVGQSYSQPFDVTLSRVASIFPRVVSIVVVLALFLIVLLLLGWKSRNVIAGRKYSILKALFLDRETDTYSLSRFQFFIWTAAAILAYLYLLLSRSLVQGKLEFVDVPLGIPGIVFVSAGTTVVAQAITSSKGPKGAGEIHPSFADLVSTGGVIVPERFQFFVWTIIGVAVFIFLVFLNDPGTIKELPQVPNGFLALMGVSSAGYLGGKAARSAGPVIDEIIAQASSLELAIKGRILSKDASFRINDQEVDSNFIEGLLPKIVEADDQGDPNTAKLLKVKILTPKPEWLTDGATLTIINPDGQKAAWKYNVGPAVTETAQTETNGGNGFSPFITITVKGVNLSKDTKATIESPGGALVQPITSKFIDPDTIEVTTNREPGVLVLTNADQRSARIPFPVQ